MLRYLERLYQRQETALHFGARQPYPSSRLGSQAGDPLSPHLFNLVVFELLKKLPEYVGFEVLGLGGNLAYADDLLLATSTPAGLQRQLDVSATFMATCGLRPNPAKSFWVSLVPPPAKTQTKVCMALKVCLGGEALKALGPTDHFKYLGVSFSTLGKVRLTGPEMLWGPLEAVTRAPLKPQQRMFGLRTVILPSLYHVLGLGHTTAMFLKSLDLSSRFRPEVVTSSQRCARSLPPRQHLQWRESRIAIH